MKCLLCNNKNLNNFKIKNKNEYFHCLLCDTIFLNPKYYIDTNEEKRRYLKHQNNYIDEGYLKFLSKIRDPMLKYVNNNDIGIDYGCGHTPVLSKMFKDCGIVVDNYDYYFYKNIPLINHYNFLVCSEVIEHFHDPMSEFLTMKSILKEKSILAFMTSMHKKDLNFEDWWYKNDPTHVIFYSLNTFEYLANFFNKRIVYHFKDVVILAE